jgi:hypothetical protein
MAKDDFLINKALSDFNEISKGLPSVARQAMRSGSGTSGVKSSALRLKMNANQMGRAAAAGKSNSATYSARGMVPANIVGGRERAAGYRTVTGRGVGAKDPGKLGGTEGQRRLAEITAKRRTRQAALASRAQQNKQATGRGILP